MLTWSGESPECGGIAPPIIRGSPFTSVDIAKYNKSKGELSHEHSIYVITEFPSHRIITLCG